VDEVTQAIKNAIPAETVLVEDQSGGCGAKFSVIVVSSSFQDKKLLDRQREANAALSSLMPRIQAITMKTWTPEQYENSLKT